MRGIGSIGMCSVAAAAVVSSAAPVERHPVRPFTSVRAIYRAAAAGGISCGHFREVRPTSRLERQEGRCLPFAAATFADPLKQKAWRRQRMTESWFPARYLLAGSRWTVWTWRHPEALALRRALGGHLTRIALPPALARGVALCNGCASPPPARPVPRGVAGPVYSFAAQRWPASDTLADGGLEVVSTTAPGTAAVTGVLVDRRHGSGHKYVAGMQVVLQAQARPPGQGAPVRIATVSDRQGGFAFIDVPVAEDGTCYTIQTPAAAGFGAMSYAALLWPGPFEATEELLSVPQADGDAACVAPTP